MAFMEVGSDGVQMCYTVGGKPTRDGSVLEMYYMGRCELVTVKDPDPLSIEILKDGLPISYGRSCFIT